MIKNQFLENPKEDKKLTLVESGEYKNGVGVTYYTSYTDGKETTIALGFCGAADEISIDSGLKDSTAALNNDYLVEKQFGLTTNIDQKKFLSQAASGNISQNPKERVELAWNLYHQYISGVIRTYVDFMTEVAGDGLQMKFKKEYKNYEKYKEFFEALFLHTEKNNNNITKQIENIFLDLFTCNNCFVWTALAPYTNKYFENLKIVDIIKPEQKKAYKQANASVFTDKSYGKDGNVESEKDYVVINKTTGEFLSGEAAHLYAARKLKWSNKQIPNVITTLCPASVDIEGTNIADIKEYKVIIEKKFADIINNLDPDKKSELSPEILDRLRSDNKDAYLSFKPDEITHLKIKTPDYLLWGEPKILAALEPIARRRRRVIGDEQAASRLIRQILLVKIGNDKYTATREQIIAAASLFKGIGTTGTIFWNHLMEIEPIAPKDISDLLKQENYEQVENEIYEALNFPMFMSGRQTSINFAMAAFLVRPIVHMIMSARRTVLEEYLRPLKRKTCNNMGFPEDCFDWTFNSNILEDYNQLAKRLVSYAQNKITSVESVAEKLPDNIEWEDEKIRLDSEFEDIKMGKYGQFKATGQAGKPGAGRPEGDPSPSDAPKSKISPKGTGEQTQQKEASSDSTDELDMENVKGEIFELLEKVIQRNMNKEK